MKRKHKPKYFLQQHSLSLVALGAVILWIVLYRVSDRPPTLAHSSGTLLRTGQECY